MPIDWKTIANTTPEELAANRKKIQERLEAKEASQRRMTEHLKEQADEGAITNDWEISFIQSVYSKMHSAMPYLSEKQDQILTRLFEKY